MKGLALLAIPLLLISCGKQKTVKTVESDNTDILNRLSDLEQKVLALENAYLSDVSSIYLAENRITALELAHANETAILSAKIIALEQLLTQVDLNNFSLVEELEATKANFQDQLTYIITHQNNQEAEIEELGQLIGILQNNANETAAKIANLQMSSNVIEYIDVCGNGPGYDEVVLKLENGTFVAYFEDKGKRFLTVLEPGKYRTTDNTNCEFFVLNTGTISWE